MSGEQPVVVVLGGINGAGKTTSSRKLFLKQLSEMPFVNADAIATGLHAFAPEKVALEAGKIMLTYLRKLEAERSSFAFESTLSGKSYLNFIRRLKTAGYRTKLYFFWLPNVEMAIDRVRNRVLSGGHNIPEDVIRTRYNRSIGNFWTGYRLLSDSWKVYDNSRAQPRLVAEGSGSHAPIIRNLNVWTAFQEVVKHA